MMHPDVDVIIGSRNGKDHLTRCLEFVYGQIYEGRIHTVVVDNNSLDASAFIVSSRYPQVQLIINKEDIGQAAAYNMAFSKGDGKYVLFLGEDVELAPNFIAEQVSFIEHSKGFAGAAGLLFYGREENQTEFIDSAGITLKGSAPTPRLQGARTGEAGQEGKEVFGPAGAAAFWSRESLLKIAPDGMIFDEDIISGHLDADIAWRARWMGYRFWYNPRATAVHHRGILYAKDEERARMAEYMRIRGKLLCYRKNMLHGGWRKRGGAVRKAVRRELLRFVMRHGAIHGMDLWLSMKRPMGAMKIKADAFQARASVTPETIYREIFSARAMK
jgi:GT2 family glycosyltransferase